MKLSLSPITTITEMKEIIIQSLSVSKFITYQNGSLVNTFTDTDIEIDMEKYIDIVL